MEATWRGSVLGLIERCGSFGGLITAGKDIFLPVVAREPAERATENVSKTNGKMRARVTDHYCLLKTVLS